jgi:hypothetical protein
MFVQQVAPTPVAARLRRWPPLAKLPDRIDDLTGIVSYEGYVISSWKFDIAGTGHERSDFPPSFDIHCHVALAMDDKRRDVNGGKNSRYVDLAIQAHDLDAGGGSGTKPLKPTPPFLKCLIANHGRYEHRQARAGAPASIGVVIELLQRCFSRKPGGKTREGAVKYKCLTASTLRY